MILEILAIIPVMVIAKYFHEFGHFLIHYMNGYKPVFHHTSVEAFSNNFNLFKLNSATFMGIVFGLIPTIVYFSFVRTSLPPPIFTMVVCSMLAVYVYCCRSDLGSFIKKEIIINEVV